MKCPKCENPRYKFKEKNHDGANGLVRRKTQETTCKKCNYEGIEPIMVHDKPKKNG